MDKKDVFGMFLDWKDKHSENEILGFLENYEITKLDVQRIYRYLDKYTKDLELDDIDDDICSVDDD